MLDRVLDDRLKHEVWHSRVERFRVGLNCDAKAIIEANSLNVEVAIEKLQLLLQRHLLLARVFQRHSQEVPEPREHLVCGIGIFLEQR